MRGFPGLAATALLILLVGCGSRSAPPGAGHQFGGVPDLRGERVMVMPAQLVRGGHPAVDQEILFALESRAGAVRWMGADALRDAMIRSTGPRVEIDALPVQAFLAGELQRVGDPLFGDLYRLGVMVDARYALIPVEVRERPEEAGVAVELAVALIECRSGRVFWYGIVDGELSSGGLLPATATAAEALARRLVP